MIHIETTLFSSNMDSAVTDNYCFRLLAGECATEQWEVKATASAFENEAPKKLLQRDLPREKKKNVRTPMYILGSLEMSQPRVPDEARRP